MEKALDSMYWYEDFFYDLNSRFASENRNYYLQGISFSISFKIVPYLQWLIYLTISDTGRSGESVLTALKNHIIDWKKIRYILMMEVRMHSEKNQRAIVNINKKNMLPFKHPWLLIRFTTGVLEASGLTPCMELSHSRHT